MQKSKGVSISLLSGVVILVTVTECLEVKFIQDFANSQQLSYVNLFVEDPVAQRSQVWKYVKELGVQFTAVATVEDCLRK